MAAETTASDMYEFAKKIFPFCRSIMGPGVRETFSCIKEVLPKLQILEIPTGHKCGDWTIPKEWRIRDAFVKNSKGEKVIDFKRHNLHIINYSTPVNQIMSLQELDQYLYSMPNRPKAIPYLTSYYQPKWGFCLSHEDRLNLKEDNYEVQIDSEFIDGSMTIGELVIKGKSEEEILISTYTCHPSMANNEVSGPVVATFLAQHLSNSSSYYTYRFVFVPETIGAVAYLSQRLEVLKKNVIAGFQLTCVGDNRAYSYMASRRGDTLADRVIKHVLKHKTQDYKSYHFLQRGSDERQYCAPGVDLPVASLMRSKYAEYPEYHTSDDNLDLISPEGLGGAYELHLECFKILEHNHYYHLNTLGEPQLGRHGLRSQTGGLGLTANFKLISDFLAFADGTLDLIALAETIDAYAGDLIPLVETLLEKELVVISGARGYP